MALIDDTLWTVFCSREKDPVCFQFSLAITKPISNQSNKKPAENWIVKFDMCSWEWGRQLNLSGYLLLIGIYSFVPLFVSVWIGEEVDSWQEDEMTCDWYRLVDAPDRLSPMVGPQLTFASFTESFSEGTVSRASTTSILLMQNSRVAPTGKS